MGGKSSQTSTTSSPPPQFLQAYQDVLKRAQPIADTPLQQYPIGQNASNIVAPLTDLQNAGINTAAYSQTLPWPYLTQANQYINAAATPITPMQFPGVQNLPGQGLNNINYAGSIARGLPGAVAPYAASAAAPINLPGYDTLSTYFNPYQKEVTDKTRALFGEQNAEAVNQTRGDAIAQNAFGGDREAIAEAETLRQQALAQDPVLAQIQQQGFAQAQQELNTQQGLSLQQQQAERQLALGAGQLTEGANVAGGQLGLAAGQGLLGEFNTQQQVGVGAQEATGWLNQGAGYAQANLGQESQNLGLAGANALLGAGGVLQNQQQQQLNVPYEQFIQQQAYPFQTTGWLANIAEGLGGASGGNATTTYPGPSTIGQIGGLATAGVGALGATGAFGNEGWLTGGGGGGGGPWGDFGGGGSALGVADQMGLAAADGGRIEPHRRAFGGGLSAVPPDLRGNMAPRGIPDLSTSIVPGARGLGDAPPAGSGGGMSKMFMQPVTTQTTSGGGGGILGDILGVGKAAIGLAGLFDDGGAVPRGTYDNGGTVTNPRTLTLNIPDLSKSYIPSYQAPQGMRGPPNPPPIPQQPPASANPLQGMDFKGLGNLFGNDKTAEESLGGAVMPSDVPLQYDEGGTVPYQATAGGLAGASGPQQQRGLIQQYANMPDEKLQELAMRYPATTPQGIAIARALQMRKMNPGGGYPGGASPAGPYGAAGGATQGTTAARGGRMGLAEGGMPDFFVPSLGVNVYPGPSYAEGEVIPSNNLARDAAFDAERRASAESQIDHQGRDDELSRRLRGLRDQQADSPVYPRLNSMSSVLDWPNQSMSRGGGLGLARFDAGGDVDEFGMEDYVPERVVAHADIPPLPRDKGAYADIPPSVDRGASAHIPPPIRDRGTTVAIPLEGDMGAGGLDQGPRKGERGAPLWNADLPEARSSNFDRPLYRVIPEVLASGDLGGFVPNPLGGLAATPPMSRDTPFTPRSQAMPSSNLGDAAYQAGTEDFVPPQGLAEPAINLPEVPRYTAGEATAPDEGKQVAGAERPASTGPEVGLAPSGPTAGRPTLNAPTAPPPSGLVAPPNAAFRDAVRAGVVKPRYTLAELNELAQMAGFAPDKAKMMAAISWGESKGITAAHNTKGEDSYGVTQINADAHGPKAQGALNPLRAFQLAFDISKGGTDFTPWSVYKSGEYRSYMQPGSVGAGGGPGRGVPGLGGPRGGPDRMAGPGEAISAGSPGVAPSANIPSPTGGNGLADRYPHRDRESGIAGFMNSPWMPLVAVGAGMLASRSPYPGVALGEGLQTGLKVAGTQQDRETKAELAEVREQRVEDQAKHLSERAEEIRKNHEWQQKHGEDVLGAKKEATAATQNLNEFKANTAVAALASAEKNRVEQRRQEDERIAIAKQAQEALERNRALLAARSPASLQLFDHKRAAWLATHNGDEEGATKFANGQHDMGDAQKSIAAQRLAQADLANDMSAIGMTAGQRQARESQLIKYHLEKMGIHATSTPTGASQPTPGTPGAPATQPAGPPVGTISGGFRFNGGNPNDRANWTPVQ